MSFYDEKLSEVLESYEHLYDYFKSGLESSPEGNLNHQNNRGYHQFLHVFNDNGKRVRDGINRQDDLIRALARKEFNTKACDILSKNINAIKKAIDEQIKFDTNLILESMEDAYALLPEEYFFKGEKLIIPAGIDDDLVEKIKRHEDWWKRPYKEYMGFPERKERTTSRGQKVRSLSELLIAESLYKYSIPFHYEEELVVDGKTFAPDFTFEGFDYKPFYLDYFGMMDDEKYAKRNFRKLDNYYDVGLIPGYNLIVVFNTKGIMNAGVIESIIENEIIPRL